MKPSIGRIVHYTSYGTPGGEFGRECRAAVITEVAKGSDVVGLAVLNPTGLYVNQNVPYDDGSRGTVVTHLPAGGTWHWPERVPE